MRNACKCYKVVLMSLVAAFLFTAASSAAVREFNARLNIVFQDGSVMFYTGANSGLVPGERYAVYSNGKRVGTVQLSRVDPYSSVASLVESQTVLNEGMMYTFKYLSGSGEITGAPTSPFQKIGEEDEVSDFAVLSVED